MSPMRFGGFSRMLDGVAAQGKNVDMMESCQEEQIADVLASALKKLPPSLAKGVNIEHTPYTDSLGDEALRVWVLFPDKTPLKRRLYPAVKPFKTAIFEGLQQAGINLFPYIRYRTKSERREERKKQRTHWNALSATARSS